MKLKQYAQVSLIATEGTYHGARSTHNVWTPFTEKGEISISQVWIIAGPKESLNTVEAGWIVSPILNNLKHHDRSSCWCHMCPPPFSGWVWHRAQARHEAFRILDGEPLDGSCPTLCVYSFTLHLNVILQNDGYRSTGCYNLECPGFVQTHKGFGPGNGHDSQISHALVFDKIHWFIHVVVRTRAGIPGKLSQPCLSLTGAVLKPVSSYNGKQYYLPIEIKQVIFLFLLGRNEEFVPL